MWIGRLVCFLIVCMQRNLVWTRPISLLPKVAISMYGPSWEGGGATYVGLGIFWGVKILNFIIFGGFQENEDFWGYEDFVDIFGGSSQNWTIFRGHFYAF